jgi:hypothetical protein
VCALLEYAYCKPTYRRAPPDCWTDCSSERYAALAGPVRSQIIFQTPQTATRLNETQSFCKQAVKADGERSSTARNRNKKNAMLHLALAIYYFSFVEVENQGLHITFYDKAVGV